MGKPFLPDIKTIVEMGINPKTGMPMKFGGLRCTTKEDIKKCIRKNDEQIAVNRYTWYNLPTGITSQELEKYLYYYGQLCFFYYEPLDQFFFAKYALDGGIDFYGRYNKIHPIPISCGGSDEKLAKAQETLLQDYKLDCVYGIKLPEDIKEEDFIKSAVLLHDYTKQIPQMIIPTQVLNDPVIDLESEVMPYLRTALLNGSGVKGLRVADEDSANEVQEASKAVLGAALSAEPYIPITSKVEFQELTDGQLVKAQDYLLAMQSIDNFRLGLHGVDNGGLFEKKSYVNQSQTGMNYAGGDVGLTLQDGLSIRQNFCNIINSIWGLGVWCDISENLINADLDGDGLAYERNEEGEQSGMEVSDNDSNQ